MLKFFKRRRYEYNLEIFLMTMFHGPDASEFVDNIKAKYSSDWKAIINEALEKGTTPEMTGAVLSSILYKDMLTNEVGPKVIKEMQAAIINHDHSVGPSGEGAFPYRLIMASLIMSRIGTERFDEESKALWFRDIHRAIFGEDDAHLDDTLFYLFKAADNLRASTLKENEDEEQSYDTGEYFDEFDASLSDYEKKRGF